MKKEYEDPVNRTFELYGSQIGKALAQLINEDPNYGRYEISPGNVVEAKYDGRGVTGISFFDVKRLEAKVQELTGDPKVRLVRKRDEYLTQLRQFHEVARFAANQDEATLTLTKTSPDQWLDEKYRKIV